ncbi:MAG: autotransporter domain-containing protein [Phascolarctobacterium sp.]|uniref:autotransporter domain-containing protein n=1 Tax=Phascolarctobacterium sp. TaxID=2049039 RepID=UPI0026DA78E3|nr:autotransporter domain-containing protein [Phascolarctobacterium sp.]MDO4920678.1 autotransporter domain-containing protein [Phascolarctobacterium sp.]
MKKINKRLSRSILCSILAASVLGVCVGAQAASLNGNTDKVFGDDGKTVTLETISQSGSSKFVIGQGDVSIQTSGSVGTLLSDLATVTSANGMGEKLEALRYALNQEGHKDGSAVITGLVGGEGKLDGNTVAILKGAVENDNIVDTYSIFSKILNINTVDADTNNYSTSEPITVTIGGETEPVVLGLIGGDLSVNLGIDAPSAEPPLKAENTSVDRNNSVNIYINSGNVLGGFGGSAAISIANVEVSNIVSTKGNTKTTINGGVTTNVNGRANVAGFANGGLAATIGGSADSFVTGNTVLSVDSTVNGQNIEGVTVGLAGGGAAITTLAGTANSEVGGTATVTINNSLSAGVIGGGVAAAIDASEIGNLIKYPDGDNRIGNDGDPDNIYSDVSIIKLNHVNQGGTATANTGNTNISLTGTTTAAGVIGGGLAVATHGYVGKTGDIENKSVGNSIATVETKKNTINVALDTENLDKGNLIGAVKKFESVDTTNSNGLITGLQAIIGYDAKTNTEGNGAAGNGAVVGVIGGGAAVALDNAINPLTSDARYPNADGYVGAQAKAEFGGAEINLQSGYAVGTFGGGLAAATNFANATSKTAQGIVINANGAEAIGVWGNGVAYFTGKENASAERNNLAGKALVEAVNTTININDGEYGVDGAYGGGIAIDDSNADTVNAIVETKGVSTINVSGEVNPLNYEVLGVTDATAKEDYINAIGTAAQDYAIVGGGVAAGGGALSEVNESVINVNSGAQVNGDILAGGIAVLGYDTNGAKSGSYVTKSTVNLNSGATVDGSVYAGGAVDKGVDAYTKAKADVAKSVVNLNGAEVTGQLVGTGVGDATISTVESALNVNGANTLGLTKEDASKITGFDTVTFAADSTTTLDKNLQAGGSVAVIDGSQGTITVANGARLDVSNLTPGDARYLVAANYNDSSSTLWSDEALAFDRTEYYAYGDNTNSEYTVTYKNLDDLTEKETEDAVDAMANSFGRYARYMNGLGREVITNGDAVAEQAPGAKAFFADATTLGSTAAAESAAAGMMMFGEAAGVTSNAVSIAQDMADTAALRLSFTQDYVTGDEKVDTDGNIWARYVKNKHDVDGMSSSFGSIYSSSDYDGVMIGADFAKVGKAQSGIAFTYGDGDSHGAGVSNDFDMWGITLFGNIKNDDSNVIADIGYSKSSNDLTGSVMGKRLTADRDLDIFSVGVRAEKLYTNDNLQVVPYAGLRFFSVDPDSYTTYYNGQKAFSYDAERQNLWTLPVGVSLRHETTTNNGWKLTPQVDVSYIWAFGDTDNDMDVSLLGGRSHLNYTVMDSGSWLGTVAFEATKADWTCGLGYSYQKGSDMQSDKWFVNVEYSF